MADSGTIRVWHTDEGWGVIDSTATPGGCWAHFSAAAVRGYPAFAAGQAVTLEWETPGQDGYQCPPSGVQLARGECPRRQEAGHPPCGRR